MSLLSGFLLLGLIQAAATSSVTTPASPLQTGPSTTQSAFVDQVLHVSYQLPPAMRFDSATVTSTSDTLLKAGGKSTSGSPCVSLPFIGIDDQDFRIAYVFRRSGDCPDRTDLTQPGQTANISFSGSLKGLGDALVGEPVLYKLNGHPTAVVRGHAFSKRLKGVIYGAMSCVAFPKEMLCFEYLAGTRDQLKALAQTPVSVDGESLPVIPEASLSATTLPDQVYRNEAGHFELTFSGEMIRTEEQANAGIKAAQEKADAGIKSKAACVTAPMSASEQTPQGPATFIVLHADSACLGAKLTTGDLGDFAQGIVKGVSKTMRNEFKPAVRYKIDGHDAVLLSGSLFSGSGHETAIAVACVVLDGDVNCFQAIAPSQETVSSLLDSPLKFDGHNAVSIASGQPLK